MSEQPQVKCVVREHVERVLFSRDLLRQAPGAPERVAADRGIPDWVKPRICGHRDSPSVHYTWEWRDREVVADA